MLHLVILVRRCCGLQRGLALAALILAGLLQQTVPAAAMEVTCIEASRYKYIYLIFNNDRRRFAQFFGLDQRNLPSPETCRAALVTDRIERLTRETGAEDSDFGKLASAISESRGWLTTLYLASPGGASTMGLRMGFLARSFWLKTHAVDGTSFEYIPDFLAGRPGAEVLEVRGDLQAGWQAYLQATRGVREVDVNNNGRRRRCASACTFIHVGGIHRFGYPYFHRGRRSAGPGGGRRTKRAGGGGNEPSMSQMVEGLHKQEARILAFYRLMDAGSAAVKARQTTATQTSRRARVPAMPRYVDDHLRTACKLPVRQRRNEAPEGSSQDDESRRSSGRSQEQYEPRRRARFGPRRQDDPDRPRRRSRERTGGGTMSIEGIYCIAAAHERERLRQFAKLCGGSDCDVRTLLRDANKRVAALAPEDRDEKPRSQRRQSAGSGGGDDPPPRRRRQSAGGGGDDDPPPRTRRRSSGNDDDPPLRRRSRQQRDPEED